MIWKFEFSTYSCIYNVIQIAQQARFDLITTRPAAVINFQSGKSVAKAILYVNHRHSAIITLYLNYRMRNTRNVKLMKIIHDMYRAPCMKQIVGPREEEK